MTMNRPLLVAALIATTGLSLASVSPAQAATAPTGDTLGGNPVPGVCMLSREAVFAQSKVGQAASDRLKSLVTPQQQQLDSQRQTFVSDARAFQQKASTLTDAQRQQQGGALQQREQALQLQANQLDQRVQATRGKVMEQIGQQAQPLVAAAYSNHHCGLLLNRDGAVLGGNTANDLTPEVVSSLDSRVTSLNFNLEPAPTGAAAGN